MTKRLENGNKVFHKWVVFIILKRIKNSSIICIMIITYYYVNGTFLLCLWRHKPIEIEINVLEREG